MNNISVRITGLALTALTLGLGLILPALAEFPRGNPAPNFKLRRLDGPPLSLTDLRGKVVFLDFWGPS